MRNEKSIDNVGLFGPSSDIALRYKEFFHMIERAADEIGARLSVPLSLEEERALLRFMLSLDDQGYYMPNLQGCIPFPLGGFYELMDVIEPRSMEEFAVAVNLSLCRFRSRRRVLSYLKECGLEIAIDCLDSLQRILRLYDIPESDIQTLLFNASSGRGYLSERDMLLLQSHEVPLCVIEQYQNIRFLPPKSLSSTMMNAIVQASRLKCIEGYPVEKMVRSSINEGFVGPFFYINGTPRSQKQYVGDFDIRRRFFDVNLSHRTLFERLGIEGDYGHYPRGRVLYDNFHQRFIVYMDACLFRTKIKESINKHFHLDCQKMFFRKDAHYTHDAL